uniref:Uncharacterized protein n=1 Tax=Anguilla anguilla TaxID=7936 RepID=A0A0E9XRY6_ANGAN
MQHSNHQHNQIFQRDRQVQAMEQWFY